MNATLAANQNGTNDEPMRVFEQLLAARHSCRAYKKDPVPKSLIERILSAAQRTASWNNTQPWQVTITSGAATETFRKLMFEAASANTPQSPDFSWPEEYRGVYLQRRRETGFQLYGVLGIQKGDRAAYAKQSLENFKLFGAPHAAIITSDSALGVYGAVDCGAYVHNFMVAAQALGVASIAQAALARHSDLVRKHFGIGDDRRVVCGISFGYAEADHIINSYRTSRAPISDAATFIES